ncbi:MAG: 50S ribosomal protein L30 [Betaproteobacteria bacterium]|nr:50S ribosomal protein L30 [Betaproteobacteria bacterium]
MTTPNKLKVQLVRSPIGTKQSHRDTVRGLGLRRVNSISELEDTPSVRGMINKIAYLVKIL